MVMCVESPQHNFQPGADNLDEGQPVMQTDSGILKSVLL